MGGGDKGTSDSLVTNNWLGNFGTASLEYLLLKYN
jgi:hypothetical protein